MVGFGAGTVIYNVFGINTAETVTGVFSAVFTGASDVLSGQTNVSLTQGSLSGQIGGGTMTVGVTQVLGTIAHVGTIDFVLDLYGALYLHDKAPVLGNNNDLTFSFGR